MTQSIQIDGSDIYAIYVEFTECF